MDKGVRVFCYLNGGGEITLENETSKFMQSVRSFGAVLEQEKARQRCRDAAERKVRQGHVTGGEPFRYENVHVKGGTGGPTGAVASTWADIGPLSWSVWCRWARRTHRLQKHHERQGGA